MARKIYEYIQKNTAIEGLPLKHFHFKEIDSTQLEAKAQIAAIQTGEWVLWTADCQTAGIGQRNGRWHSPDCLNVYATYGFRWNKEVGGLKKLLPLIGALSVAQVLEKFDFSPSIKWVNDVLVAGKKIAGVVVESKNCAVASGDDYLFLGIGMNVNAPEASLINIGQPVTSMAIQGKQVYAVDVVLDWLTKLLVKNISMLLKEGGDLLLGEVSKRLERFNNVPICFDPDPLKQDRTSKNYVVGRVKDVNNEGHLQLEDLATGKMRFYVSGRIVKESL